MDDMNKKKEIIPAIIAENQNDLETKLNKVTGLVNIVQLDFMDNKFVPNSSLWFDYNLPSVDIIFEAHLMIKHPLSWIEKNLDKIDIFLVHYESSDDISSVINLVRDANRSIGLVINPGTSIKEIVPYLDRIDQVLVMTVNPGFYGSPFLPETLRKIRWLASKYPDLDLEVDGGITAETISEAFQAGANKFVSGSFIIKSADPQGAINSLKQSINL
jgi:ribulose-phosphate 3-epimerase